MDGYRCDLNTRRCIRSDAQSDVYPLDTKVSDIRGYDIKYYDIESEIVDNFTIEDVYYVSDIKDSVDSGTIDGGICEIGTFVCRNNDLYKCNENNDFVFEKSCEKGCIKDHCMECLPNEKRCKDDTTIEICNNDGTFYSEACSYKCYNNQCVICLPSDKYCNDKTAVTCHSTGTAWSSKECEIGCMAGECMICRPNTEKKCVDNNVYVCLPSGMDFKLEENCCHDNNCSNGKCVKTSPRVIDYNPESWKVGSTVYWDIIGCFFITNASKVMIDFGGSWKEITEYSNYEYKIRAEQRIQIKVNVLTGSEYNFKVVNPDGQESSKYPIKKHY